MIEITGIEQGTPEWHQIRLGVVTASRFDEIITTKGKPSESRKKYMYDLAGEIITGEPKEGKKFGSMQKGNDREQESRYYYSQYVAEQEVRQVTFVYLDNTKRVGCSPDGLVDPSGGFETKNAEPHVQIRRLEEGMSKALHFQQVQGGLWVCEREWWDLQSYCRGMKSVIIRYERDEKFISQLKLEVTAFIQELDELVKKYQ